MSESATNSSPDRVQTQVEFFPIVLGVAFGACSMWAFTNGHPIGGIILGVLAFGGFYFGVRGTGSIVCPYCSKQVSFDRLKSFVPCQPCAEWVRVDKGAIHKLPAGFISETPVFEVRLRTLGESGRGLPNAAVWPSPNSCCVCGTGIIMKIPTDVTRETITGFGPTMGVKEQTFRFGRPCCAAHRNGVCWEISGRIESKQVSIVTFRSLDYWRAFRAANTDVVAPPGWGGEGS